MNIDMLKLIAKWIYPSADIYVFNYRDNDNQLLYSLQLKTKNSSTQFHPQEEPLQELHLIRKYKTWLADNEYRYIGRIEVALFNALNSTEDLLESIANDEPWNMQ